jgi:hypothetical protein
MATHPFQQNLPDTTLAMHRTGTASSWQNSLTCALATLRLTSSVHRENFRRYLTVDAT